MHKLRAQHSGMHPITTRKATLKDLPFLLEFEQGVISAERPFDHTLKAGDIRYYDIEMMITAPHIYLLVAENEDQLVGSGYVRLETSKPYLQHEQHAYLGFMYVVPAMRGKGINKIIMDGLAHWVFAQNISELRLDVYFQNEAAIKAYERAGFSRHMIEMRKEIIL